MTDFGHLVGIRVDLATASCVREELPAETGRAYLGGRGIGAYLLLRERTYDIEPLSPDSPIVFAAGPLAGLGVPGADRYTISAKSPLTNTILDGNSGSGLGAALRHEGLDFLMVEGACESPKYLLVSGGSVEILPAEGLWGLNVSAALRRLQGMHGACEAAVIGPAGEHGVLFASVANSRGHQIGRGGLGAVLGSKRVKAVVVDGGRHTRLAPARSKHLRTAVRNVDARIRSHAVTGSSLPRFGTAVLVNLLNEYWALPTRNFRESRFAAAEALCGETLRRMRSDRHHRCGSCPVACSTTVTLDSERLPAPQYESIWALGADCGIGDLRFVVRSNALCNEAGLDTITMGSTLACAMELAEEGVLERGPRFGCATEALTLIHATTTRRELGNQIALGSRRLATHYGRPDLAMEVKGLEMPGFDPRAMTGQGLAFATSNRGACHSRANMLGPELLGVPRWLDPFATSGKSSLLIELQDLNAALDALVVCKFTASAMSVDDYSNLLTAAIGEAFTPEELLLVGERVWNAEKLFNLLAGFTRDDDTLPRRVLERPASEGPAKGSTVNLEPMLDEYYSRRGWGAGGVPSEEKLAQFGLESFVARSACDETRLPAVEPNPWLHRRELTATHDAPDRPLASS